MNTQVNTLADEASVSPRLAHAGLLMASQVIRWSLRLNFVVVVARVLGPTELGVYALVFTVVEFVAMASGAGYIDYLTREAAKDARVGWGLAFQLMGLRTAIAVPVALIAVGLLSLLGYPHRVLVGTAWMAATILPRSVSEAVQGVLRGIHRYASYFVIELVLGASLVAGSGVLFVGRGGLRMAISAEVLAALAAGLAAVAFALKFRTSARIHLPSSQLLKKSSIFNVYGLIGNLYDRFDVVLLSKLAGDYATGIYSLAYRALTMTQVAGYGVLYSLLPTLSKGMLEPTERKRLDRATGLLLSAAYFVVLTTMIFAGPAIVLVLGPQYGEAAEALRVLIWAVLLRYINYALNTGLLAAGHERVFVRTTLTCLVVNLFGNLVLIPRFGWWAAAVMTILTELALLVQNIFWIRRTVGYVPVPLAGVRVSVVFVILLATTLLGGRLVSPILVGTGCLVLYGVYLYGSGMISEFAAVWGPKDSIQHGLASERPLGASSVS